MGRSALSQHSFDHATVQLLRTVYDDVWTNMETRVTSGNTMLVQDAIAVALIDLALAGQLDPAHLEPYALERAWTASFNAQARAPRQQNAPRRWKQRA